MKFLKTFLMFSLLLIGILPFINSVDDLERWSIDRRFSQRGPRRSAENIILVGIDQDTRDYANRPSFLWSALYADFIRKLGSASASGVLFDIVFPTNPDEVFREFVASFLDQKGVVIPPNLLNQMSFDQSLRAAIIESRSKGPMVFLGLAYEPGQTMRMRNPIIRTVPPD